MVRQEDHFPKVNFSADFAKLGSEIIYLFLAEKWSFVLFVLFVAILPKINLEHLELLASQALGGPESQLPGEPKFT